MTSTTEHTAPVLTSGAFLMTVTNTDGSVHEGICTEAQAARSLATAARRGYSVEVLPNGGASIMRKLGTGYHAVRLTPARYAGKLTATVRQDLALIASRHRSDFDPATGRIKAGYVNSIPPGASGLLMARGLVTLTGTAISVSLSARLAMLAQDNRPIPWAYKPTAGELNDICDEFLIPVSSKGAPMTETKNPTPQGISALLRKAGFNRSERQGRAGGSSSGFRVGTDWTRTGAVRVRHVFWSMGGGDAAPWLAKYARTITEAGWTVEAGTYELIVTAKEG
jgi:hypothetical protein